MFDTIQTEVMERFTAVKEHFRASRSFRGKPAQMAKGMVFVQVYAIWEYSFVQTTREAGRSISNRKHRFRSLRTSLLPLFAYNDLQSLRRTSEKNFWKKAIDLFRRIESGENAVQDNPAIPQDGSHYRHTQLILVMGIFGVRRKPTQRLSFLYRIDEVVDHRNSIAHGEETADSIGKRYTRAEITKVIRQMEAVCLRMIQLLSEQCDAPDRHCR